MNADCPVQYRADGPGDVGLVVAAAGHGRRFCGGVNKLLVNHAGMPLVCHCLTRFAPVIAPGMTVLVVAPSARADFRRILTANAISSEVRIIAGAETRQESVWLGLQALPASAMFAAIHDAARPFCTEQLLRACIESARKRGSGVAASPVTDTIKMADADGRVLRTPPRAQLWSAQTPQVFRTALLRDAYAQVRGSGRHVTDDAEAVECCGHPVYLVQHTTMNRKITYSWDMNDGKAVPCGQFEVSCNP